MAQNLRGGEKESGRKLNICESETNVVIDTPLGHE